MKKIIVIVLAVLSALPLLGNNTKLRVAVFDPTSSGTSIDEGTKVAIREIISSTMVNAGNYEIVERSLLEKVMQEQSFSNSGAVNDDDATEIGKLAGANKVVISVVTLTGGRNMLSVKMIDVKTASVDRQKVKVVSSGELLDVIEPLTLTLIDVDGKSDTVVNYAAAEGTPAENDERPVPQAGEVVFWLPEGFQPANEKDKLLPLLVSLDKEDIGSGTVATGFLIRIQKPAVGGVHTLKIGAKKMKIDLDKYNFFEIQLYLVSDGILGTSYGVSVKEQKKINPQSGNMDQSNAFFEPCAYDIPVQYDKYLETEYFHAMGKTTKFNVILDFSDAKIGGMAMQDYLSAQKMLDDAFISEMNSAMHRFITGLSDESKHYFWAYNSQAPVTFVVKFREISPDGKTTLADYVFVDSISGTVLTGIRLSTEGGKRGSFPSLIADALTKKAAPEIVKYLQKKKVGR